MDIDTKVGREEKVANFVGKRGKSCCRRSKTRGEFMKDDKKLCTCAALLFTSSSCSLHSYGFFCLDACHVWFPFLYKYIFFVCFLPFFPREMRKFEFREPRNELRGRNVDVAGIADANNDGDGVISMKISQRETPEKHLQGKQPKNIFFSFFQFLLELN